jgi:NH3-dependent NAD+ synthetase
MINDNRMTISQLLKALQNPDKVAVLENSKETWSRIGNKDRFEELGMEESDLDAFLSEWISDNPYSNL